MFTVKVVESRNDAETVFEATQVRKTLNEAQSAGSETIGTVVCDLPIGHPMNCSQVAYDIRSGRPVDGSDDHTMYVMNRHGATVATYHL